MKLKLNLIAVILVTLFCSMNVNAQTKVTVTLCTGYQTPTEHQGDLIPNDNVTSFSSTGSNNNVFVVLKFEPFGKSVGLRTVITKDSPDGKFEQDRVASMSSTQHNCSNDFSIKEPGKYCLRVVDEFDESIKYSDDYYFTVK